MNDFLGKPIDPASLRAVLTRLEPRFADPLDDYLPQDHNGPILLDKAVIDRLTRTFDHAMLSGLMTDMLSESAEMISQMQRAAINQDHAELRVKAHTLKGMAMTLGIAAVGEKAADIESAVARDEKAPALMGMVSQLQQIFEQSKATIFAWQDSH
jgi:HPt (histidine-containing phosphotransfer) domain-containing protein